MSVREHNCSCHDICTSRFTKCGGCHEICTSRFTKCCACHEICTLRVTERCACHVQMSRFTAPVTKSELLDDHHMSKVVHLPRKLHLEVKPFRSLAPVTKSRLWSAKTRGEVSLAPATISDHHVRKKMRAAPQRERSRGKHPPPAGRFCEPAQSKCTWTMSRVMDVL